MNDYNTDDTLEKNFLSQIRMSMKLLAAVLCAFLLFYFITVIVTHFSGQDQTEQQNNESLTLIEAEYEA